MSEKTELQHVKIYGNDITLGSVVRITDPFYKTANWCTSKLQTVKPGVYKTIMHKIIHPSWGQMVSAVQIHHIDHTPDPAKFRKDTPALIGVDSGRAGFVDEDYYSNICQSDEQHMAFYASVKTYDNELGSIISTPDNKGVFTTSGNGDGMYRCFIELNDDNQIVSAMIKFD